MLTLVAAASSGCLVPPRLEEITESTHAPRIVAVAPAFGDLTRYPTPEGQPPEVEEFFVTVEDSDPQTLYALVFMDGAADGYEKPLQTPEKQSPTSNGLRPFTFTIDGICDEPVNHKAGRHELEIYFSDTGFRNIGSTGQDQREPNPGGFVTNNMWRLDCAVTSLPGDGGL